MRSLTIQPIPYQGSKRALAPRICKTFPARVTTLYEPFAGSAAVTLYAASHDLAEHFVIGDIYGALVDIWELIIARPDELVERYALLWQDQFTVGANHFNEVRARYNNERDPVALLYLVARCVKNAVRFNRHGHFTQSVDKRRTGMRPEKMARNVKAASRLLCGRTSLYRGDFRACMQTATPQDLVYMDPPYQGTTYGKDKRYIEGLGRSSVIEGLMELNQRQVPFILSYDGQSGDKTYGEPLPPSIDARHLTLAAGRSSQATLVGRNDLTFESLYVSAMLHVSPDDLEAPQELRLIA